jgi:hypothetical protein
MDKYKQNFILPHWFGAINICPFRKRTDRRAGSFKGFENFTHRGKIAHTHTTHSEADEEKPNCSEMEIENALEKVNQGEVVAIELPAPPGWKKKVFPYHT